MPLSSIKSPACSSKVPVALFLKRRPTSALANESESVPDETRNTKIGFYVQFDVYSESGNVGGVCSPVGIEVGRYKGTWLYEYVVTETPKKKLGDLQLLFT